MRKIKVIIFLSIMLLATTSHGQFKKKHFKKIPAEYSKEYLITHEITSGRRLSYASFKNGNFITASEEEINNFMNTMLLGSATHLFDYLKEKHPDFSPIVIIPNSGTSTTFYIKYKFDKGEVFIIRAMKQSNLLLDPFAAEKPENYSLLFAFKFDNISDQKEIESIIMKYVTTSNMKYEIYSN